MDAAEATRRQSNRDILVAKFRAHSGEWLDAHDLMALAGAMAWRTRVSDCRKIFQAEGGALENRQTRIRDFAVDRDASGQVVRLYPAIVKSEYRYLAHAPLARDAGTFAPQDLKTVGPYTPLFELT